MDVRDEDATEVRAAVHRAQRGLVGRETIAEVVVLCAVAREHLLVVGPPGTGKSEAVRRVAAEMGGQYFEYLLGRFTEPNEIFGPVDLRRLRDGIVEIETAGMLPEADIAFLDEVFLGSTAILNTLLGVLNERTFRRGSTVRTCPLRVCVGATNTLPEDHTLTAFSDRFLTRLFVDPVPDAQLDELLESGWSLARTNTDIDIDTTTTRSLLGSVDRLADRAQRCNLDAVRPLLATAIRRLRASGVTLTDRRAVRVQKLIAAAATVDGRERADGRDLWVVPLVAPSDEAQALAQEVLADLLETSRNDSLVHSAAELSRGPRARAERLARTADEVLTAIGTTELTPDERLRLEGVLREIDSSFRTADLPDSLRDVRSRLMSAIGA